MKGLGIDFSTRACGYAVMLDGTYRASGVRCFKSGMPRRAMYNEFEAWVSMLLEAHTPDIIIVEDLRGKYTGRSSLITVMALAPLVGIILKCSTCTMLATHASSWKARVLHNGHANKACAVEYVQQEHGIVVSHDEAEAICIIKSFWCAGTKFHELAK